MPTYDYKCNECGHRFELFQSMRDKPIRKCPECGKSAVERLIGVGAGIIFKGSGFYETDYRSESYKKAAEAEKKSSSDAKPDTAASTGGACACGKNPAGACGGGAGADKSGGSGAPAVTPSVNGSKKTGKKKPNPAG